MKSPDAPNGTSCLVEHEASARETSAPSSIDDALSSCRAEIDRVLNDLPKIRLEARRVFTRELGFNPTPEQLQTIDNMAHGPASRSPLREILRSALALRLVTTHALEQLLDSPRLDAEQIRSAAGLLPGLGAAVGTLEETVRSDSDGLGVADRDCLLRVSQALIPSPDLLITGEVLASRLELLALAGKQGEVGSVVPSLTDEDVALVRTAVAPQEDWSDGACRVCINALTLRTIIEDDLESWEMFQNTGTDESRTPGTRGWGLSRLRRDKIAYGVISESVQKRQDTALVAGLREFADELSRVKGSLFSSYLKLNPALRSAAAPLPNEAEATTSAAAQMQSLLEECAVAEEATATRRAGAESTDELYLSALKGLDGKAPAASITKLVERDIKRERRRLRVMVGVAAVLLAVVVVQYGLRLRGKPTEQLRLSVADLTGKLFVNEAMAVGPMMYAQVTHFSWDDLDEQARIKRVEDLALLAEESGFEKVYLTDEHDQHLATWSKADGVELAEPTQSPPGGVNYSLQSDG